MLDELGLNEDVMYFHQLHFRADFLLILLRLIGENRILYQKIYHANQDGTRCASSAPALSAL